MARDYVARNRRPPKKPAGVPGWVWMVAGLSIGLAVAAFVYISRPTEPMPMSVAAAAAGTAKLGPVPDAKGKIPIPPKEDPRFRFYDMLENQEVIPSDDGRKPATAMPPPVQPPPGAQQQPVPATTTASVAPAVPAAAPAPATNDQYLIIVGSFQTQANAEQHKASLALAGVESRIEKITVDDRQTWYRVRVGPEKGLARAQSVLAQIKSSGFDGRVVRMP